MRIWFSRSSSDWRVVLRAEEVEARTSPDRAFFLDWGVVDLVDEGHCQVHPDERFWALTKEVKRYADQDW